MKIIIKTWGIFPEDLACELASRIVGDDNKQAIYTWDSETKIYAHKRINKNGTIVISFWDESDENREN